MIKEVLKELGLTQKELAEQLDLDQNQISLIVTKKQKVTEALAVKIADVLGIV
jgi:addiction module HigA family antidote